MVLRPFGLFRLALSIPVSWSYPRPHAYFREKGMSSSLLFSFRVFFLLHLFYFGWPLVTVSDHSCRLIAESCASPSNNLISLSFWCRSSVWIYSDLFSIQTLCHSSCFGRTEDRVADLCVKVVSSEFFPLLPLFRNCCCLCINFTLASLFGPKKIRFCGNINFI